MAWNAMMGGGGYARPQQKQKVVQRPGSSWGMPPQQAEQQPRAQGNSSGNRGPQAWGTQPGQQPPQQGWQQRPGSQYQADKRGNWLAGQMQRQGWGSMGGQQQQTPQLQQAFGGGGAAQVGQDRSMPGLGGGVVNAFGRQPTPPQAPMDSVPQAQGGPQMQGPQQARVAPSMYPTYGLGRPQQPQQPAPQPMMGGYPPYGGGVSSGTLGPAMSPPPMMGGQPQAWQSSPQQGPSMMGGYPPYGGGVSSGTLGPGMGVPGVGPGPGQAQGMPQSRPLGPPMGYNPWGMAMPQQPGWGYHPMMYRGYR